jgi:hypothetical protein
MATNPVTAASAAASPAPSGLKRQPHWATRGYHQFLIARAKMPFVWGANDCALFAADGILAIAGVDIAADFRGKYDDEASALEAIKTIAGGSTIADAAAYCAQKHGLGEWPHPLKAQRGDLVVIMESGRLIAGLVHLNGSDVVSVGQSGLLRMPITQIQRAWHVGPASTPATDRYKFTPRALPAPRPSSLLQPVKAAANPLIPANAVRKSHV